MKKVVLFDMDGTLLDTEPLYYESNRLAFEEIGEKLTKEAYLPFVGAGSEKCRIGFCEMLGDEAKGNAVFARAEALFDELIQQKAPDLKPRTKELLDCLEAMGVDCYVASSSVYDHIVDMMNRKGIAKYFKGYVGGDQVEATKPQPDIFQKALAMSGYAVEDALVIEDSLNGVRASYNANIDVIMIPDLIAPNEEVFEKATAVVGHMWDILPFVGK